MVEPSQQPVRSRPSLAKTSVSQIVSLATKIPHANLSFSRKGPCFHTKMTSSL